MSNNEFGINLLYYVSLPVNTWQCDLKSTGLNIKTLEDKGMISLLGNNIRGGISSVMGARYVKADDKTKIMYVDADKFIDWALSESLPYDETEKWHGHSDL